MKTNKLENEQLKKTWEILGMSVSDIDFIKLSFVIDGVIKEFNSREELCAYNEWLHLGAILAT